VTELIEKEVQKGFVYDPFSEPPFKNYRVSPIGVAEGKYSKKKRLILDLSCIIDFNIRHRTFVSINQTIDAYIMVAMRCRQV
jgi:hypothetical protein